MKTLRTPDERFESLPGYSFAPHYSEVPDGEGGALRIHHLDEGAPDAELILCLHGQPTWSFLYRKMIPVFVEAGFRVIAPDFVGFGRSDKPTERSDYTYARHVAWMSAWLEGLDLRGINLFCQDWGGLIGLRLVAAYPERFARVVAANTGLPDGGDAPPDAAPALHALYDSLPIVKASELFERFRAKDGPPGFLFWRKYCAAHRWGAATYVRWLPLHLSPRQITPLQAPSHAKAAPPSQANPTQDHVVRTWRPLPAGARHHAGPQAPPKKPRHPRPSK